jgi:catechol 2,3-dioxygenase-like lactoylglutathione lyase family enzyme
LYKSGSVTIVVDDLKKSSEFYIETLGFKMQFQIEGHLVQVEAPGLSIGLVRPREGQENYPEKSGNIHIGLEVDELESVMKLLKSRGVDFQPIIEEEATRIAYFPDPEGNLLYLIELK